MINTHESKLGQSVFMTEIYDFLGLTSTYYTKWVEKELLQNPYLSDNVDYCTKLQVSNKGGRFRTDYHIHIDAAKKLCMVAKSDKGNELRNELVALTKKVENSDLLTHQQVLIITALKTFFKYVDNQQGIKKEHLEKFTSEHARPKSNPFAEFHNWRNKILNIEKRDIDKMILNYTIENQRQINQSMSKDKIINIINSYDGLKNAVWDFLSIKGEVNALKIAELIKNMAEIEHLEMFQTNEKTLFRNKENIVDPKILMQNTDKYLKP